MGCKRQGYRGVRRRGLDRYTAEIAWKNNKVVLGTFATPEEAALAYDGAARSLRGFKARTNFPAPSIDPGSCSGCVAVAADQSVGIIRRGLAIDLNEPPPPWL